MLVSRLLSRPPRHRATYGKFKQDGLLASSFFFRFDTTGVDMRCICVGLLQAFHSRPAKTFDRTNGGTP